MQKSSKRGWLAKDMKDQRDHTLEAKIAIVPGTPLCAPATVRELAVHTPPVGDPAQSIQVISERNWLHLSSHDELTLIMCSPFHRVYLDLV